MVNIGKSYIFTYYAVYIPTNIEHTDDLIFHLSVSIFTALVPVMMFALSGNLNR